MQGKDAVTQEGRLQTLTVGQLQGLCAAGVLVPWGIQWGTPGYVLGPGMTWGDVDAALTVRP
jgi:hypothetical protein